MAQKNDTTRGGIVRRDNLSIREREVAEATAYGASLAEDMLNAIAANESAIRAAGAADAMAAVKGGRWRGAVVPPMTTADRIFLVSPVGSGLTTDRGWMVTWEKSDTVHAFLGEPKRAMRGAEVHGRILCSRAGKFLGLSHWREWAIHNGKRTDDLVYVAGKKRPLSKASVTCPRCIAVLTLAREHDFTHSFPETRGEAPTDRVGEERASYGGAPEEPTFYVSASLVAKDGSGDGAYDLVEALEYEEFSEDGGEGASYGTPAQIAQALAAALSHTTTEADIEADTAGHCVTVHNAELCITVWPRTLPGVPRSAVRVREEHTPYGAAPGTAIPPVPDHAVLLQRLVEYSDLGEDEDYEEACLWFRLRWGIDPEVEGWRVIAEAREAIPAVREERAPYGVGPTEDEVMEQWGMAKATLRALLAHGVDDDADPAQVADEFLRALAAPVARALNAAPAAEPLYRCTVCKGTNVQLCMWVRPTHPQAEPVEDFGSWDETDTKWCDDCQAHVALEDIPQGADRVGEERTPYLFKDGSVQHIPGMGAKGDGLPQWTLTGRVIADGSGAPVSGLVPSRMKPETLALVLRAPDTRRFMRIFTGDTSAVCSPLHAISELLHWAREQYAKLPTEEKHDEPADLEMFDVVEEFVTKARALLGA